MELLFWWTNRRIDSSSPKKLFIKKSEYTERAHLWTKSCKVRQTARTTHKHIDECTRSCSFINVGNLQLQILKQQGGNAVLALAVWLSGPCIISPRCLGCPGEKNTYTSTWKNTWVIQEPTLWIFVLFKQEIKTKSKTRTCLWLCVCLCFL